MGPTCSRRCAIHRREAAASHVHCELVRRCRRRSRSRSSSSIRILTQQRTPSRPGRQSHSSVTTATRPPKKQSHIISQQCLQSLWSPWLKSRSKGTFGLTLPPNDASFSLYAVLSLRCIFFTLLSQQRTPSRPGRQSHSSVTTATYPPEEAGPHHITAVSPVTLLTLVENRSKGTFGLTLPPNDASFSLYAVFSSRCCHSSELPVALAARATHQSRQPHAPRRNRATSYHSSVSSHSGHPG
jgi:hypothetical protein